MELSSNQLQGLFGKKKKKKKKDKKKKKKGASDGADLDAEFAAACDELRQKIAKAKTKGKVDKVAKLEAKLAKWMKQRADEKAKEEEIDLVDPAIGPPVPPHLR